MVITAIPVTGTITAATPAEAVPSTGTSTRDKGAPPGTSQTIQNYLVEKIGVTSSGGKVFCAYEPLADMDEKGNRIYLYVWVLCQEYYLNQQGLEKGTGSSLPVAITMERKGDSYTIVEHKIPGEVALAPEKVQAYFPPTAWPKIMPSTDQETTEYNNRAKKLENETETKAKEVFSTGNK